MIELKENLIYKNPEIDSNPEKSPRPTEIIYDSPNQTKRKSLHNLSQSPKCHFFQFLFDNFIFLANEPFRSSLMSPSHHDRELNKLLAIQSILKTSDKYKSDISVKFKQSEVVQPKHCSFDDDKTKIIPVDNWKEYNYNECNEPDDCSCNCILI